MLMDKEITKALYCIWDDFLNYFTDFNYFPLAKIFGKLQDMGRIVITKRDFFKRGYLYIDGFSDFH